MTRLLIILLFTSSAIANIGNQKRFSIDIPQNWQMMKDFYGVPFTFLGPAEAHSNRPTIQIIPSDQKAFRIDKKRMKTFDVKHKRGKEAWLKKVNGHLIKYEPMQEIEINKQKMYISRAVYKFKDITFDSKRYFTFCNDKFFELKTLTTLANEKGSKKNQQIIESFRCK